MMLSYVTKRKLFKLLFITIRLVSLFTIAVASFDEIDPSVNEIAASQQSTAPVTALPTERSPTPNTSSVLPPHGLARFAVTGASLASTKIPTRSTMEEGDAFTDGNKSEAALGKRAGPIAASSMLAPLPSASTTIGIATDSLRNYIFRNEIFSVGPILRSITFGAQLAITYYLAKVSWAFIKEVWEELNEEFMSPKEQLSGTLDLIEEQDLPYADEETFNWIFHEEEKDANDPNVYHKKRFLPLPNQPRRSQPSLKKLPSPQTTAARDLAIRLRSSGIPYSYDVSTDANQERNTEVSNFLTVENVLKSLTRSEGNILSQTILTPFEEGVLQGNSRAQADSVRFTASVAAEYWNSIGGLADAKESLLDLVFPLLPAPTRLCFLGNDLESNHVMDDGYYGGLLANPPGVLLYGPPGCGKSMLVRALAATVGVRFLVVSPSCLMRKYVGETNLNVRALFSVAKKISPCIIFVDELDGLFRERGGEDHDVGRDLKTEFLQLWDGIRNSSPSCINRSQSSILVIGATNRPFDVDPAFLRRMPRRVFVGLPDNDARTAILQNMLNQVPLDSNFDINLVSRETEGYSPSDIREVLQTAALYPLREARAATTLPYHNINGNGTEGNGVPFKMRIPPLRRLRTDDILRALERVKPTQFSQRYQNELTEYMKNSVGIRGFTQSLHSKPLSVGNNNTSYSSQYEKETDEFFFADVGTFNGSGFYPGNFAESDTYLSDQDDSSSESDTGNNV